MRLVIVGAGGFGREVLDVVEAIDPDMSMIEFLGFVDDGRPDLARLERRGSELLGTVDDLDQLSASAVIGVGDPAVRERLVARIGTRCLEALPLVHPSASLGAGVVLGVGAVVAAGARLTTNIRIGRHAHLNLNCTVGHDVVAGDFLTVNPGATISGDVSLGDRVSVGTNAAIIQGVHIGDDAVIGAGAAVVKDVPARTTVVGVPAKPLRR